MNCTNPHTDADKDLIREYYPNGGSEACLRVLGPRWTAAKVRQMANTLGLSTARRIPHNRRTSTDEIDAIIRRAYGPDSTEPKFKVAKRLKVSGRWMYLRATDLGLVKPRVGPKNRGWTVAEDEIIRENAHMSPTAIQKRLKKVGYARTETAVAGRRKVLGLTLSMSREDEGLYTPACLSDMLGVGHGQMSTWIKRDDLRTRSKGGESIRERLIHVNELRRWIIEHPARIDLRKIPAGNHPWFIELIAGRAGLAVGKALEGENE